MLIVGCWPQPEVVSVSGVGVELWGLFFFHGKTEVPPPVLCSSGVSCASSHPGALPATPQEGPLCGLAQESLARHSGPALLF